MNVNGITGTSETSYTYQPLSESVSSSKKTQQAVTDSSESSSSSAINSAGAVYEPSTTTTTASSSSSSSTVVAASDMTLSDAKESQRKAIIAKLKADSESRTEQLRSIVEQMISKQGSTYADASGDNMWKILASGDFTVDAATKKQAQEDVSEDGYYGVKQTSDRIVDFAQALAGDDTDKLEDMRQAFIKGFKQATNTWGKELPQISQDTYKAVMDKFDKLEGKTSDSSSDTTSDVTDTQA